MKRPAQAELPSLASESSSKEFASGEYLRPQGPGVLAFAQGSGAEGGRQLGLELELGRLKARVEGLEVALEVRSSELFLARERERLVSSALAGAREAPEGALLVLGRGGLIESINQAGLSLLGYEEGELVGQPLDRILDAPAATCLAEAGALSPEGTAIRTEQTWVAKSGLRVRVLFSIAALAVVDEKGQPCRFVCTAFELAARTNWELSVRQTEKSASLGRLTAGVAHEIGTPIQFVRSGVHFLRDATVDVLGLLERHREVLSAVQAGTGAEEAALRAAAAESDTDLSYLIENMPKALRGCLDGLDRVATVARSLREFAEPRTREMIEVDLNRALENMLNVARNEWRYVAHVVTDFAPLPPVACFAGDMNQAILNLVVNAAHAIAEVVKGTDEKGRITVRTRLEGDDVIISVEDDGAGIPEPIRERIFDPFFTTKETGQSTGQGLGYARTVVAGQHRGRLWFETVVGQGTTFFVRLPCRAPVSASMSP